MPPILAKLATKAKSSSLIPGPQLHSSEQDTSDCLSAASLITITIINTSSEFGAPSSFELVQITPFLEVEAVIHFQQSPRRAAELCCSHTSPVAHRPNPLPLPPSLTSCQVPDPLLLGVRRQSFQCHMQPSPQERPPCRPLQTPALLKRWTCFEDASNTICFPEPATFADFAHFCYLTARPCAS